MSEEFVIRASSLGKIMTDPRTKADGILSAGARTHIRELAAQAIFGVDFEFSSKETEKGILVEQDSIDLVNRVRGLSLVKNTERRTVRGLTGEPDCIDFAKRKGHDIKSSWSLKSFPLTEEEAEDKAYDWQARAYMALFDVDEYEINFCMVDTPEHLCKYEPPQMHLVGHLPEHHRITTVHILRQDAKERAIFERIAAAKEHFLEVVDGFHRSHKEGSYD